MSQYITKDTRYGFGDTKINSSYFHEELFKLGWERIDFTDEPESKPEEPIEVIEERLWVRTNMLFEKFIQELFNDTIESYDELASCGFFSYFLEYYIKFDNTCLNELESLYSTPVG